VPIETARELTLVESTEPTPIESRIDWRVRENVERAIRDRGYPTLQYVTVFADRGRVILRGKVPNYYSKQLAQTAAMRVAGVRSIQNEVVVC
jgi:osmotically-inducible protein OsmY